MENVAGQMKRQKALWTAPLRLDTKGLEDLARIGILIPRKDGAMNPKRKFSVELKLVF